MTFDEGHLVRDTLLSGGLDPAQRTRASELVGQRVPADGRTASPLEPRRGGPLFTLGGD